MNNSLKFGLMTLAIGAAVASTTAQADVVPMGTVGNAPAICQAFTPGVSNTIRNRVVGSENIGSPIAVACDFLKPYSTTDSDVIAVQLWFSNNNANPAALTVNCTMLTGFQGFDGAIAINKTQGVTPADQEVIQYDPDDTVDPSDTDLGSPLVGVNCTLPTGIVINDTYMLYTDEDGVGV